QVLRKVQSQQGRPEAQEGRQERRKEGRKEGREEKLGNQQQVLRTANPHLAGLAVFVPPVSAKPISSRVPRGGRRPPGVGRYEVAGRMSHAARSTTLLQILRF